MLLAKSAAYASKFSIYATSDKVLALLVWLLLHVSAVWVLFLINSDLRRAYDAEGWRAATGLAALGYLHSVLYIGLYNIPHAGKADAMSWGKPPAADGLWMLRSSAQQQEPGQTPMAPQMTTAGCGQLSSLDSRTRFCKQCSSWQAAVRTHHCRHCGICVPGFDHHCHWLGTCIGDSNHSLFWCYVLSQTTLCLYGLHHGLTAMRQASQLHFLHAWGLQQSAAVVYTTVMLVFSLFIATLLILHTFLILSNWKTCELIKGQLLPHLQGRPAGSRSPFDRGPASNLYNFVFNRQLYNSLVEDWKLSSYQAVSTTSLWDNSWYSCC